jgi:tetratricopeptide (TPR) repeat protein
MTRWRSLGVGTLYAFLVGEFDAGAAFIDQALMLNPNLATAWMFRGLVSVYRGEPDVAIKHLAHATRLSPFDPLTFIIHTAYAHAHFFAGRYDESSAWAEKVLRDHQDYQLTLRVFVAANALSGRQEAVQRPLERLRQLDPALRVSNLQDRYPLRRPEDLARFADGLRKAGLPE